MFKKILFISFFPALCSAQQTENFFSIKRVIDQKKATNYECKVFTEKGIEIKTVISTDEHIEIEEAFKRSLQLMIPNYLSASFAHTVSIPNAPDDYRDQTYKFITKESTTESLLKSKSYTVTAFYQYNERRQRVDLMLEGTPSGIKAEQRITTQVDILLPESGCSLIKQ